MDSVLNNGPRALLPKGQLLGQLSEREQLSCFATRSPVAAYRHPGISLFILQYRAQAEVILVTRSGETWKLIQPNVVLCVTQGPTEAQGRDAATMFRLRDMTQDELRQSPRPCDLPRQLWEHICIVCAHMYQRGHLCLPAITETTGSVLRFTHM